MLFKAEQYRKNLYKFMSYSGDDLFSGDCISFLIVDLFKIKGLIVHD